MSAAGAAAPQSPARIALPVSIFVAVLWAFLPVLEGEFLHFDDDKGLTGNPHFRGLGAAQLEWMFTTNWMGPYQPLAWLSLALDHELWGMSAARFHLTSVVIHALGAVALYGLARAVFRIAAPAAEPVWQSFAAGAAALLFAVHPLRVESVAWITERRDVLSGLFAILAAHAWVRWTERDARGEELRPRAAGVAALASGVAVVLFLVSVDRSGVARLALKGPGWFGLVGVLVALIVAVRACSRSRWYALAFASLSLALFSKGLAVVVPAALCVLDVWPLGRGASWRRLAEKAPLFALSAIFSVLAVWGQAGVVGVVVTWAEHDLGERLLQTLYALSYYPARTLAPTGLMPIYELPDVLALAEQRFFSPAVAVPALTAGLVLLRRRAPAALAAWIAFALLLAPVTGLVQRGPQLVADRYSYLACMPLALAFGGALLAAPRKPLAFGCAAMLLFVYGALTQTYAAAWRSSATLWAHAVAANPASPMARMSLAVVCARAADETLDSADPELRAALYEEAASHLEHALEHSDDPRLLGNLSQVRGKQGRADESIELAERALAAAETRGLLTPEYPRALGLAYLFAGRAEEALAPLERAARLTPDSASGWRALAEACEAAGQRDAAVKAWRRVVAVHPGHERARERLAALGAAPAGG
jgi:tetratricopeptide (TPR) repeat protein